MKQFDIKKVTIKSFLRKRESILTNQLIERRLREDDEKFGLVKKIAII